METLPPGWTKQWSTTYSRYFYVNTLAEPVQSCWEPPARSAWDSMGGGHSGLHLGGSIDPGLIGHVPLATRSTTSSRPYVLQGSLWSASDPATASLTPWQARSSPSQLARNDFTRTSLSSDGGSTPSSGYATDDLAFPYRADPVLLSTSHPLSLRSTSPMLGYLEPTPTAYERNSPSALARSPWSSDAEVSFPASDSHLQDHPYTMGHERMSASHAEHDDSLTSERSYDTRTSADMSDLHGPWDPYPLHPHYCDHEVYDY